MEPDVALLRAWELADEEHTDAVADEFELLLPTLIQAGYADAPTEHTWRFTPDGVRRAEFLTGER